MTESSSSTYAVLSVTGTDAASFLRAQLTNDVDRLGPDRHFLAAWCDAKGRAIAILRIVARVDGFLLLLPSDIARATVQRLRMYVLRAKVTIEDCTERYSMHGQTGADLPEENATRDEDGRVVLGLPPTANGMPRALVLGTSDALVPKGALAVDSPQWRLSEIDAGVPELHVATQGMFVPQMLNLHWLHAVDFDKGCYPGQEIIARLHYRGRLTRRLFRLQWTGTLPQPGDEVLAGNGDAVGGVVQASPEMHGGDGGRLLAVIAQEAALAGALHTSSTQLDTLDLPYATPA